MKKTEQNVFSRHPEQRYPPQRRHLAQDSTTALLWAGRKREAAIRREQLGNDLARAWNLCTHPFSLQIEEDKRPFGTVCAERSSIDSGRKSRISFARGRIERLRAQRQKIFRASCRRRADPARGYACGGSEISAFKVSTNFDSPSCLVMTASNPVPRDTWSPKSNGKVLKPTILT